MYFKFWLFFFLLFSYFPSPFFLIFIVPSFSLVLFFPIYFLFSSFVPFPVAFFCWCWFTPLPGFFLLVPISFFPILDSFIDFRSWSFLSVFSFPFIFLILLFLFCRFFLVLRFCFSFISYPVLFFFFLVPWPQFFRFFVVPFFICQILSFSLFLCSYSFSGLFLFSGAFLLFFSHLNLFPVVFFLFIFLLDNVPSPHSLPLIIVIFFSLLSTNTLHTLLFNLFLLLA